MLRQFQYPADYLEVFEKPEFPVNVREGRIKSKYDTHGLEAFDRSFSAVPRVHKSLIDRMASWAEIVPPILPHTRSATAMLREPIEINGETVYGYVLRGVGFHGVNEMTREPEVMPPRREAFEFMAGKHAFNYCLDSEFPMELVNPGSFGGVVRSKAMRQLECMSRVRQAGLKTNIPLGFAELELDWRGERGAMTIEGVVNPMRQRTGQVFDVLDKESLQETHRRYVISLAKGIREMFLNLRMYNWQPHHGNTGYNVIEDEVYYYDFDSIWLDTEVRKKNIPLAISELVARFLNSLKGTLKYRGKMDFFNELAKIFVRELMGDIDDEVLSREIQKIEDGSNRFGITDMSAINGAYVLYLNSPLVSMFGDDLNVTLITDRFNQVTRLADAIVDNMGLLDGIHMYRGADARADRLRRGYNERLLLEISRFYSK